MGSLPPVHSPVGAPDASLSGGCQSQVSLSPAKHPQTHSWAQFPVQVCRAAPGAGAQPLSSVAGKQEASGVQLVLADAKMLSPVRQLWP